MDQNALQKLSPADAAWLKETFSRNRMIFGGWSMDGSGDGGDGGSGGDGGTGGDGGSGGGGGAGGDNGGTGGGTGGAGGSGGGSDDGKDLGFPKDTPVAEMKPEEQAAYWKHQARKHETRASEWSKVGKTPAEVQAELNKLRTEKMTDQERAVKEAEIKGRSEGTRQAGLAAARMAFEFALGHDAESNDQSDLIDTLDLTKVVKDDGQIDTAKVRSIASKLGGQSGKGGQQDRERDFGGGRRGGGKTRSGGGKAEAERRFGTKTTSTQGA